MSRIPFVAAVVGALLIGGATTGGTHASWTNGAQLASSTVNSGSMDFLPPASAGFAASFDKGGAAQTTVFTVTDHSFGKNLKQQITATVSPDQIGFTVSIGNTCATATGTTATASNNIGPAAAPTTTFCAKATPTGTAASGNITVALSGQQQPSGWSTPGTKTVTIPVAVNSIAPSAPGLSCGSYRRNGEYDITWTPPAGETFTVLRSTTNSDDASFTTVMSDAASPYTAVLSDGTSTFWRVKGSSSGLSNVLKLTRVGNGIGSIECGAP